VILNKGFALLVGQELYSIDTKAFVSVPLKKEVDGFSGVLCGILQTHLRLLFSYGVELCVDTRISSNRNKYRIEEIIT
jgi:hypothetical protein